MASYRIGVDIGGTFTDCVVVDAAGAARRAAPAAVTSEFSAPTRAVAGRGRAAARSATTTAARRARTNCVSC
jgi:N-methylhydantoinase A